MPGLGLALAIASSVTKAVIVDAAPTRPRYCDSENTHERVMPTSCSRRFQPREEPMTESEFKGMVWSWMARIAGGFAKGWLEYRAGEV